MTKPGDSQTKKTLHELAKEFPNKTYKELEKYRDADRVEEAIGIGHNHPPEESLKKAREVLENDAPYDESLWKSIIELGWTATTIPEEFDGLGLGYLELCVIAEELGRSLAPTPFSSSVYLATEALIRLGSPEQRKTYLPKLASGEIIGTLAHNESFTAPTENNINCKYYSLGQH